MLVLSVCLLLSPVLGAVVTPPAEESLKKEVEEKKLVEEEVDEAGVRKTRQDIPWAPSQAREAAGPQDEVRTHWGSGFPNIGHHQQQQPQVTLNLQGPWYPGSTGWAGGVPQQPGFFPRPTSGVGCGGQTVTIQDTHFATQQVPQTYTASVPFIAGYRLTPVIGQKQIVLNDLNGGAAVGSNCGYWQNIYGHARQANKQTAPEDILWPDIKTTNGGQAAPEMWLTAKSGSDMQASPEGTMWLNSKSANEMQAAPVNLLWPSELSASGMQGWPSGVLRVGPEEILRPFEEARYFQPPLETDHGLEQPHHYQAQIEDAQHRIEHLQSLRDSTPDTDNVIAS